MSIYSAIVDGKVLDYHYKKIEHLNEAYYFYVGDIHLGMITKRRTGWCAVSMHTPCPYGVINGFNSRTSAAEFILQVCRIEDYYKQGC